MTTMVARSRVEYDPMLDGVRLAVSFGNVEGFARYLTWPAPPEEQVVKATDGRALDDDAWLRLPEDVARAIYEALSSYYGGSSDGRTLRSDYDAERKRVDQFISHLTRGA